MLFPSLICAFVCQTFSDSAYCQNPRLTGIVVTVGDKPLAHVEVRIVGVATSLTTDSGEFQVTLPKDLMPETPVLIQVKNWIVIDPHDGGNGRTYVHRDSSEPIRVLVGRKGDSAVLADSTVIQDIVQQVVHEVSVQTGNKDYGLVTEATFLAQRAEELGFTVDQLKKAISSWADRVEGPYQRALLAVYEHRYLEADKLLAESISASQTDLVRKFLIHATVANKLGKFRDAESLLEKAQTLEPANRVVRLRLAEVLVEQAKYSEARRLYLGLIETNQSSSRLVNSASIEAAEVLNDLGQLEFYVGDFKSAREHFRQALSLTKNLVGPEHAAVAAVLGNIAELDREEGKFAEAEQEYREALRLNEKNFGPVNPEVAADLAGLTEIYYELGKYDVAEPLAERALRVSQSLGIEGQPSMARELNSMGAIRVSQKKYTEANALLREALRIEEETIGPMHPRVAVTLNNLATSVEAIGDTTEAEALWKRALDIDEKSLGVNHPTVANRLNSLALLYWKSGRLSEAEALSQRALKIDENAFGPDHFSVGSDLNTLALIIEDEGRVAEAEELYLRSLRIIKENFGDSDYRVGITEENLSHALRGLGKVKEAEIHQQRAKSIREKNNSRTNMETVIAPSTKDQ